MYQSLSFGEFDLRPRHRQLLRSGREVAITTRAFELLVYLATRPGELVTKDELVAIVWKGGVVTDAALTKRVQELRTALGDDARAPRFLSTVARRGFRFVAEVTASSPTATPPPPWFVGRAAELERLRSEVSRAHHGERSLVFVTGPAGIGKSALVDTLVHDAMTAPFLIGRGACIDQSDGGEAFGEPFLPLLDALAHAMRRPNGRTLTAALQANAPGWLRQLPGFVDERDLANATRRAVGMTQPRLLRELTDACEACAETRPLLLTLEDLHWSDPGVLAWLEHFARRRDSCRIVIIATVRSPHAGALAPRLDSLMTELVRQELANELQLEALQADDVAAYVARRVEPDARVAKPLADALWARSNGNPLLMRTSADELARTKPAAWSAANTALPEHVQRVADHHVAASDSVERIVLWTTAALGRPFTPPLVASIAALDVADVEIACARLVQRTLFLPLGAEAYMWAHELFRVAVYASISKPEREAIHTRIALDLERQNGEPTELAAHFERAGSAARGLRHRVEAGLKAMRNGAHEEAERHFERALALKRPDESDDHENLSKLYSGLGTVSGVLRGSSHPDGAAAFRRALEYARAGASPHLTFRPLYGLITHHLLRAEIEPARTLADELLHLAIALQDPLLRAWHGVLCGRIAHFGGDMPRARDLFEGALAVYPEHAPDPYVELTWVTPDVLALCYVAPVYGDLGYPESAFRACERAIARAQHLGTSYALAFAHYVMAQIRFARVEPELARMHANKAIEIASHNHYPAIRLWAEGTLCALTPGEASLARLTELVREYEAMGLRQNASGPHTVMATILADLGRFDDALAKLDRSAEIARSTGECVPGLFATFERGSTLIKDPARRSLAVAEFERVRDEGRRLGARAWTMRGTLGIASAVRDDPERFRAAVVEAAALYSEYTEGYDSLALKLVRLYCQLSGLPTPAMKGA